MHLLNALTHKLEEFYDDIPSYAILSHRWGTDEISFHDLEKDGVRDRPGYAKIEMICKTAAEAGISYAWIDTCCINKTDSAELSESINSMYRLYQDATVCYAYLADVPADWRPTAVHCGLGIEGWNTGRNGGVVQDPDPANRFQRSQWFQRGWTLQELLAPSAVVFLN